MRSKLKEESFLTELSQKTYFELWLEQSIDSLHSKLLNEDYSDARKQFVSGELEALQNALRVFKKSAKDFATTPDQRLKRISKLAKKYL